MPKRMTLEDFVGRRDVPELLCLNEVAAAGANGLVLKFKSNEIHVTPAFMTNAVCQVDLHQVYGIHPVGNDIHSVIALLSFPIASIRVRLQHLLPSLRSCRVVDCIASSMVNAFIGGQMKLVVSAEKLEWRHRRIHEALVESLESVLPNYCRKIRPENLLDFEWAERNRFGAIFLNLAMNHELQSLGVKVEGSQKRQAISRTDENQARPSKPSLSDSVSNSEQVLSLLREYRYRWLKNVG